MALAFPVNIPFVFSKLIYFLSKRFFPKTVRLGALSGDREKLQKNRETLGRTVRVRRSDKCIREANDVEEIRPGPTIFDITHNNNQQLLCLLTLVL